MSSSSEVRLTLSRWSDSLPQLEGQIPVYDPGRIEAAVRQGYDAGFDAGHTDGMEAGYADGRRAATDEVAAIRRQLGAVLLTLRDQLHSVTTQEGRLRETFEAAIVDTAVAIAREILQREIAAADDPGRDALRRALAVAPTRAGTATVHLHPEDAQALGQIDELAPGTVFTIVPDHAIERGGCVLRLGDTTIDAQIESALQRVREELA